MLNYAISSIFLKSFVNFFKININKLLKPSKTYLFNKIKIKNKTKFYFENSLKYFSRLT